MVMRNYLSILFLVLSGASYGQSPQNISVDSGESESLWNSTTGIVLFVVFVVLLVIGRTWSKRIHQKRDELSDKK
jgi:Flp pilus assembly protein TadB